MPENELIIGNGIDAKVVHVQNLKRRLENADKILELCGFRFTTAKKKDLDLKRNLNPFN